MEYIANTDQDRELMLRDIGVENFEALLQDIPLALKMGPLKIAKGLSELELLSDLKRIGQQNKHTDRQPCFLGAGVYDHYIPPVVNNLATRGEFITAYTPYQGEASQGTLQTIYEYQSMICMLTGMDVSNASMYDGASAVAEAALLALRHQENKRKIVIGGYLHPEYLETLETHLRNMNIDIVCVPLSDGVTDIALLKKHAAEAACVIVQQPNFLGYIEDLEQIFSIAKASGAISIACVNPLAMSILKSPGECGADVVVGEGQPLGNAMSYGGPHFGFFAVKKHLMRKLPGRIVGRTLDHEGSEAFVLTLQAREQHIRREKATSNICTNHALCALKSLIFCTVLGPHGFRKMGSLNVQNSHLAYKSLTGLACVQAFSKQSFFNEFTILIDKDAQAVQKSLANAGLIGPLHLGRFDSKLEKHFLVAVTEQRTKEDIQRLVQAIEQA